jgi:hypothetical protein
MVAKPQPAAEVRSALIWTNVGAPAGTGAENESGRETPGRFF